MADRETTAEKLADLVDRIELLHEKLNRLELRIQAQLRRN